MQPAFQVEFAQHVARLLLQGDLTVKEVLVRTRG